MTPDRTRFPLVDGLRAMAALGVFAYHVETLTPAPGQVGQLFGRANTGVVLFFVISGFLLWRPFAGALLGSATSPDVARYARNRFLRIVPAYWVVLTAFLLVTNDPDPTPGGLLPYYLFAQGYDGDWVTHGIGQAWTLSVEVAFYVLLPVLAVGLAALVRRRPERARRVMWAALAALFAVSVAFKAVVLSSTSFAELMGGPWPWVLPWSLDFFAVGMALAVLSVRAERPQVSARAGLALWGVAAVAFWFEATQLSVRDDASVLARHGLDMVVATALFVPGAFCSAGRSLPARILGWRPLAALGVVSYSFYLLHLSVLTRVAERTGSWVAVTVLGLGATAVVATACYLAVERPAMRLRRRRRPPVPVPAPQPAAS